MTVTALDNHTSGLVSCNFIESEHRESSKRGGPWAYANLIDGFAVTYEIEEGRRGASDLRQRRVCQAFCLVIPEPGYQADRDQDLSSMQNRSMMLRWRGKRATTDASD